MQTVAIYQQTHSTSQLAWCEGWQSPGVLSNKPRDYHNDYKRFYNDFTIKAPVHHTHPLVR